MLTRLFLIAVFWYAVFRFIGRMLRFLSGPAAPGSPPAAGARGASPGRSEAFQQATPGATSRMAGAEPAWDRGEVIDVEYEEVKPTHGRP